MEKKELIKKLAEGLKKSLRFFVIVLSISLGYTTCEIYHSTKRIYKKPKNVMSIKNTSVAINERNELMIIDRSSGDYEIYTDSVGMCIFNLYAKSIQSRYSNPQ